MPLETYSPGYGRDYIAALQKRSVETHAHFLTPHLRRGTSLIDCGCGPGSITIGLAQRVAPGRVLGVDIEPGQIDLARQAAAGAKASNAEFEVTSIYELPVEEGQFDIGFVHNVLLHISDPVAALREVGRVLRPGGVIAICHSAGGKLGGSICHPPNPALARDMELYAQLKDLNGCASNIGPRQRELLLDAGFERVEASVHSFCEGTTEAIHDYAALRASRISPASDLGRKYVEKGLATADELSALGRQWLEWGETPGAFFAVPSVAALGWKGADLSPE